MRLIVAFFIVAFSSCARDRPVGTLAVEPGKRFSGFELTKIWEKDLYGRWCLPCANGVVCCELTDRSNREYWFYLYDYGGTLIKRRRLLAGQGPALMQSVRLLREGAVTETGGASYTFRGSWEYSAGWIVQKAGG